MIVASFPIRQDTVDWVDSTAMDVSAFDEVSCEVNWGVEAGEDVPL